MSSYIYCDICGEGWDVIATGYASYVHKCSNIVTPVTPFPPFITKDSGSRQEYSTGMKRDIQAGKPRYDLIDRAMLKRWAGLMARGAIKYGENNWKKAATEEELNRFKSSAIRHLFQWMDGETDEDHAAAICFNVSGAEMVSEKLKEGVK